VSAEEWVTGALYLRQSMDRTGEALAISRQRTDGRDLADRRRIRILHALADNDRSAAGRKRREGFERLLQLVERREVRAIVAWSLDRLTRNRRDTVRLIEACQKAEVSIILVRGSDMDLATPAGRLAADILASVARHEIEVKSDRQTRAQRQAAVDGRRVGGRRPFGYDGDGVTVRESEATAVRAGYRAVLSGVSLSEVAREWNQAGHVTPQRRRTGEASPWRRDSVRDLLLNPRYAGLRGYAPTPERGRRKVEVMGAAEWRGVVDEATWRAVRAVLTDEARRRAPNGGIALLSGLALCGVCGEQTGATVHSGGSTTRGVRTYRCSQSLGHVARRGDPVDRFVSDIVIERLSRPDARELLIDSQQPDVAQLRDDAVALRSRLDSLAVDFADGELTASQLRTATERVRTNLAAVEARMADAGRVDVLGPLVSADDVRAVWDTLSVARRRAVIDTLMVVTVCPPGRGVRTFNPDTVGITWRTS
jgi:DNA invertase Pin-like site-specific DNA recombinase